MLGSGGMVPEQEDTSMEVIKFLVEKGVDPAQFSEEELKAMYRDYAGERATLANQQGQADALRASAGDGLGGTQAGNLFVADSPFEAIGSIGKSMMARGQDERISELEGSLSQADALARQAYARETAAALRGGAGGTPAPNATAAQAGASVLTPKQVEEQRRRKLGMRSA